MSAYGWPFVRKCITRTASFYVVASAVGLHVGELVHCSGPSMHPTIHDGDLVIAERLSVNRGNIHRGDIIGALGPNKPEQLLCKRVFAKERDHVICDRLPHGRVPRGHVFLRGDNADASSDSRHFGPVPQGLVQIRLCLRVWPPQRWGWLSTHWFWEEEGEDEGQVRDY